MQPIFTMQYGEFAVADFLSKQIKNASVFIPASAQEKGIDLLLYRHENGRNLTNTIQVKMSRTYYKDNIKAPYPYSLWFNKFNVQQNANWYILVGIYAKHPSNAQTAKANSTKWDTIMLAFKNNEMAYFMAHKVKQKKNPSQDDKMFGFSFNAANQIFQTRGVSSPTDMSQFLISNRIVEINNSFI